jgi:hypothetical protein
LGLHPAALRPAPSPAIATSSLVNLTRFLKSRVLIGMSRYRVFACAIPPLYASPDFLHREYAAATPSAGRGDNWLVESGAKINPKYVSLRGLKYSGRVPMPLQALQLAALR